MSSDDIVKRLQVDYVCDEHTWKELEEFALRNEAADVIKARDAEIERLRAEHDNLRVLLRGRTAEFQAEVERLRVEIAAHEVARLKDAQEHWLALAEAKRLRAERDAIDALHHSVLSGDDEELNTQFALVDAAPVRSKRPVRPQGGPS